MKADLYEFHLKGGTSFTVRLKSLETAYDKGRGFIRVAWSSFEDDETIHDINPGEIAAIVRRNGLR